MRAADVMTPKPVTVSPDTSIMEAIRLMLERKFSGLPVIDTNGSLVGIVTEGDLLRRSETGTQRKRAGWIEFLMGQGRLASEYVHASGRKVREVMSPDVQTVTEDAPLDEIVQLMERHRIKRLPVVRDGLLVGIVSRANLLQALAVAGKKLEGTAPSDDATIRDKVITQLDAEPWTRPSLINVIVQDGTVELWGIVDSASEKKAVRIAAEVTPGVRAVNDNLIIRPAEAGY
jgi:CBS-domain-containing membrane protein